MILCFSTLDGVTLKMEFILSPGGFKIFAFVEKGVKPPKVLAISFATNWRRALKDEATFPVALGTSDGIHIWQHNLSGWKCYFNQKYDGGVQALSWSVNAHILAYVTGLAIYFWCNGSNPIIMNSLNFIKIRNRDLCEASAGIAMAIWQLLFPRMLLKPRSVLSFLMC